MWYFYNISCGWCATEYYICTQKPVSELKRSTESQLCAQCTFILNAQKFLEYILIAFDNLVLHVILFSYVPIN